MGDSYQSYSIKEGTGFDQSVPFHVSTAIIDNTTASWLYFNNAGRYIPPWQYGVVAPLSSASQSPQFTWSYPSGIIPPTAGAGSATVTYTTAQLPASNGQPIIQPSQQTLCTVTSTTFGGTVIGGTKINAGVSAGGSASAVLKVPGGTNSLILLGTLGADAAGGTLTITGVQSGTVYFSGTFSLFNEFLPVEMVFSSAADTSVTLTIAPTGNIVGTVELSASTVPQAVGVENDSFNPLSVVGSKGGFLLSSEAGTTAILQVSGTNSSQTMAFLGMIGLSFHIYSIDLTWGGGVTAGTPSVEIVVGATTIWQKVVIATAAYQPPQSTFPGGGINIGINTSFDIVVAGAGAAGVVSLLAVTYATLPF